MQAFVRPALLVGIIVATAGGVVACGSSGGSSASTTSAATTSAAAASSSARPSGAGRANPFADPTVAECLKAAGIVVPTFTRPSGSFTRPSGSFTRPSGSFTRPSGAGGGFGGLGTDCDRDTGGVEGVRHYFADGRLRRSRWRQWRCCRALGDPVELSIRLRARPHPRPGARRRPDQADQAGQERGAGRRRVGTRPGSAESRPPSRR